MPPARPPSQTEEAPIAAALAREGRRRLGPVMLARTLALVATAAIVGVVTSWPDALFWLGLILVFALLGAAHYAVGRSRHARDWMVYAFTAFDLALLAFTLIYPNPIPADPPPPQAVIRYNNFVYLFIILGALGMTLRPRLILWGGACGAVFWSLGVWWLTTLPGATWEGRDARPAAERMADLHYVDLGVQAQSVGVFLIVSGLIAAGSAAARRLAVRETAAARRAANLSRYLPAEAVSSMAERDAPFTEEREAEAAVLFTDIVGFSGLAERRGPRETIELLRQAHGLVAQAVSDHGGVVDKFIGDGVMATFGVAAALEREAAPAPAERAFAATRAILAAAARWNEARAAAGERPVRFAIGLHHGLVVIGDMGSARRMELAVIGDTVNVAARLETICRALDLAAAYSEEAMAAARWPDGPERIGPERLRGRDEPVIVWGLRRSA